MSWKVLEYVCEDCRLRWESLEKSGTDELPCPDYPEEHPVCKRVMSAVTLSFAYLGDDQDRKAEALRKRSEKDTQKEVNHNAEKFGMRPKSIGAWNVRKLGSK